MHQFAIANMKSIPIPPFMDLTTYVTSSLPNVLILLEHADTQPRKQTSNFKKSFPTRHLFNTIKGIV